MERTFIQFPGWRFVVFRCFVVLSDFRCVCVVFFDDLDVYFSFICFVLLILLLFVSSAMGVCAVFVIVLVCLVLVCFVDFLV